jgi:hypothetical protein
MIIEYGNASLSISIEKLSNKVRMKEKAWMR